ncbi:hypothetical protein M440DRAFT_1382567 [Trichoderma longibrachiatum ATCC 18648]|uniref:Uncharacterized protein n=1 Tax=Trichoderma longibrachiatum ATCC 18648 TaxID=983965 RepID=A0A2T4BVW7_TRILO|nr:hypothetical protein M440DRAFT_1382567 [Trichoderma longibrachiatum ATCC 18648]
MMCRFAPRRKGCIEIASRHVNIRLRSLRTMTNAINTHQTSAPTRSLQRCISYKVETRRHCVLWGSRLLGSLTSHKFCTQTTIQSEAPSPKDNSEPTRVRLGSHGTKDDRDKALLQEAIGYADSLKANRGEDGFLEEKNNLSLTPELGFCGRVYIAPKYRAIDRAKTIVKENSDYHHFIFFVDGSLLPRTDAVSGSVVTCTGTAVVYKPLEPNQPWVERVFVPSKCERGSDWIEVIALLNGLKVAAVETDLFRRCDPGDSDDTVARLKATIFSDCTSALQLLVKLQSKTVAKSRLLEDPVVRELIAMSQYLHRRGVAVELRWVPGHSQIEGNTYANGAAQYAARHPEIGAILEERLQVTVEVPPNTAESHASPQNSSQKNKPEAGGK